MTEWKTLPLGEIASIERNGIKPTDIPSGTTYVGLENIKTGGSFVNVRTIETGELASTKFLFSEKHVLYGKLRPYLAKIARPTFSGICSTDILPILPGPELNRGYLAQFLRLPAMVDAAASLTTGANLPRISPKALEEFQIPLPSLGEQQRIAELLDRTEALRARRRAALAQLDALTQSIFLDLFGDPATNPKDWSQTKLGELLVKGPQNGLYKPSTDYGSGTQILRIDAFYDGVVTGLEELKRVRISHDERHLYALRSDDIVINRVNSLEYLGKSALIPKLMEPVVFESNMMRLAVNTDCVSPVYVIQFLQTNFVRTQIRKAAKNAVNQSSINQRDVAGFVINVPPLTLQAKFARRVAAVEKLRAAHRASLAELDALFASLQYRAFRGEL